MKEQLIDSYGFLFEDALIEEICEVGKHRKVKEGDVIIEYGQTLEYMPLLLDGAIKVMRQDEEGEELLLYYLEKGDTCTMTLTCCMGEAQSEICAVAETDSDLILIPVKCMEQWMQHYRSWMQFVLESYSNRFNELLESVDSLAFSNMHDRVFKYLKNKVMANKSTTLHVTHQEMANDLHSSRVVLSRILKGLEREGKIALKRNNIEVIEF